MTYPTLVGSAKDARRRTSLARATNQVGQCVQDLLFRITCVSGDGGYQIHWDPLVPLQHGGIPPETTRGDIAEELRQRGFTVDEVVTGVAPTHTIKVTISW